VQHDAKREFAHLHESWASCFTDSATFVIQSENRHGVLVAMSSRQRCASCHCLVQNTLTIMICLWKLFFFSFFSDGIAGEVFLVIVKP
jgi:hypothetical protein